MKEDLRGEIKRKWKERNYMIKKWKNILKGRDQETQQIEKEERTRGK